MSSSTISTTCPSTTPLGRPGRSPFSTRLHPVLRSPHSSRTRFDLTRVTDIDSVHASWPLNLRRPTIPSPSSHWKRTGISYSKSGNPKPPCNRGLRVALMTTPGSSPGWTGTRALYSSSGNLKPPHVGGLWVPSMTIWPLTTGRPTTPSSSLCWRGIWTLHFKLGNPKPPLAWGYGFSRQRFGH